MVPFTGAVGPTGTVELAREDQGPVGIIVNIVESVGAEIPGRVVMGNVPFPDVV